MSSSPNRVEYSGEKESTRAIANQIKEFMRSLGLDNVTRRRNTVISDRARVEVSRQRDRPIVTIDADRDQTAQQIADFASGETVGSTDPDEGKEMATPSVPDVEGELQAQFGQVWKPFGHEEARFFHPAEEGFDTSHPNCHECAHFDGEGNCHIVPNIVGDGYCERFYADAGFFVDGGETIPDPGGEGRRARLSLSLWGERLKALEGGSATAVVEDIKDAIVDKIGVPRVQFLRE